MMTKYLIKRIKIYKLTPRATPCLTKTLTLPTRTLMLLVILSIIMKTQRWFLLTSDNMLKCTHRSSMRPNLVVQISIFSLSYILPWENMFLKLQLVIMMTVTLNISPRLLHITKVSHILSLTHVRTSLICTPQV